MIVSANDSISYILNQMNIGEKIDVKALEFAFYQLLTNENLLARDTQLGALLLGIMAKSPTESEICALIKVALEIDPFERMKLNFGSEHIVCCAGSGKKGYKTINISTPASIVAASAGAIIVKPGSQSTSSVSGSSDFMMGIGVKISDFKTTVSILEHTGLGFFSIESLVPRFDRIYGKKLFVPNPLSFAFPALLCPVQYDGLVYGLSHHNLELSAKVLRKFGVSEATIVSCSDDNIHFVDELGLFQFNYLVSLRNGFLGPLDELDPIRDLSIEPYNISAVRTGQTREENVKYALDVLKAQGQNAHEDVVALNAAALLIEAKKTNSLVEGFQIAKEAIQSGKAYQKLIQIIKASGGDITKVS